MLTSGRNFPPTFFAPAINFFLLLLPLPEDLEDDDDEEEDEEEEGGPKLDASAKGQPDEDDEDGRMPVFLAKSTLDGSPPVLPPNLKGSSEL